MRVLGIDPAPAKDSVIFDGKEFQHFSPKQLKEHIDTTSLRITTDDELDAFVCWLMGRALIDNDPRVRIYGDRSNGSFLLPYDAEIYNKLNSYLYS